MNTDGNETDSGKNSAATTPKKPEHQVGPIWLNNCNCNVVICE